MKNLQIAVTLVLLTLPIGGAFAPAQAAGADDVVINVRDRPDATLTPMDEGNSAGDRAITQQIRKAVVADDRLSSDAHNVTITTIDAVVTLRGPVKNSQEKTTIVALAQKIDGVKSIDDELEVEGNP